MRKLKNEYEIENNPNVEIDDDEERELYLEKDDEEDKNDKDKNEEEDDEDDEDDEDMDEKNKKTIKENFDFEFDVKVNLNEFAYVMDNSLSNALTESLNLDASRAIDFKRIFEAAVNEKIISLSENVKNRLISQANKTLVESIRFIAKRISNDNELALDHTIENWINENRVDIQNEFTVRKAEKIIENIKNVLSESDLSECENDNVSQLAQENKILRNKVFKLLDENKTYSTALEKFAIRSLVESKIEHLNLDVNTRDKIIKICEMGNINHLDVDEINKFIDDIVSSISINERTYHRKRNLSFDNNPSMYESTRDKPSSVDADSKIELYANFINR